MKLCIGAGQITRALVMREIRSEKIENRHCRKCTAKKLFSTFRRQMTEFSHLRYEDDPRVLVKFLWGGDREKQFDVLNSPLLSISESAAGM